MNAVSILGGTGQQGRGLARRLAAAGVTVTIGSRDPARARQGVSEWPMHPSAAALLVADNIAAVVDAALVILAVPFTSVDGLLDELRPHFSARAIVVDVTVPVTFAAGKMAMLEVTEGSASEHVRARLPEHVGVAAAFKTIPAHVLDDDANQPLDCDEFVCGDSEEARARAVSLVQLLPGLRPVDVGPLSRARSVEHLTALAIAINRRHKIHEARYRIVGL
jgi:8-hydroxy-5-deazaflavin:NADPH oxidoreductase